MSRDHTLKTGGSLARHRNVLTRAERVETLEENGKWDDGRSPLGLPKVSHRKATIGSKKKKKKDEAE